MSLFQAVILGALQGFTEFLPISSSGHLVLIPYLLGWDYQSLAFDTILHLGTATALLIYFFRDWMDILRNRKFLVLIIIGSIPAMISGVLLNDFFETHFRGVGFIEIDLLLGTFLLILAEILYKKKWHIDRISDANKITVNRAFLVGLFQALSLFPGISRSGATISGGIYLGFTRELAAKFSFMLSLPIILGAGFFQIIKDLAQITFDYSLVGGYVASFLVGLLCIKFLMNFLKTRTLWPFVVYRLILAGVIFFTLLQI